MENVRNGHCNKLQWLIRQNIMTIDSLTQGCPLCRSQATSRSLTQATPLDSSWHWTDARSNRSNFAHGNAHRCNGHASYKQKIGCHGQNTGHISATLVLAATKAVHHRGQLIPWLLFPLEQQLSAMPPPTCSLGFLSTKSNLLLLDVATRAKFVKSEAPPLNITCYTPKCSQ